MTIQDVRRTVAGPLGLPDTFDGSIAAYAELTQAQQIQVAEAVDVYINANPSQFTADQVKTAAARVRAAGFGQPIPSTGFLATVGELPNAMLDSAAARLKEATSTTEKLLTLATIVTVITLILRYGPRPNSQ